MTKKEFEEQIEHLFDENNTYQSFEYGDETETLTESATKRRKTMKKTGLRLFDADLVQSEFDREKSDSRRERVLEVMKDEDSWKVLVQITEETFQRLDKLEKKFPNFKHVIERFRNSLTLRALGKTATVWLPPILLVGPAGVGKTRFLSELAQALGIDYFSVDMATASASFVLSGSSSSWSEGKPGFVSNSLRASKVANPLLLIDEIDKATSDTRHDPIACFYSLLEKHTAKTFKDECVDIPMDCSHINWVASANYIERIPEPIRSRMEVIEIQPPTQEQMPVIASSTYDELLEANDWGHRFIKRLNEDVLNTLTVFTPREMGKVLEKACATAAVRSKGTKAKIRVLADDIELPKDNSSVRIGF